MITILEVDTIEEGDALGDVSELIEYLQFEINPNEGLVIKSQRDRRWCNLDKGDLRVEITREEAIKMAKGILFALSKD